MKEGFDIHSDIQRLYYQGKDYNEIVYLTGLSKSHVRRTIANLEVFNSQSKDEYIRSRISQINSIEQRLFAQIEETAKNNSLVNRQKTAELQIVYTKFCV